MSALLKDIRGFTMTEFMISVVILTVAIAALFTVRDRLTSANAHSRTSTAAVAYAEQQMELLKRQASTVAGFNTLASGDENPIPGTMYRRIWTVASVPGNSDMRDLTVTVRWNLGEKSVRVQTLVLRP